jgi:hypothetical protein
VRALDLPLGKKPEPHAGIVLLHLLNLFAVTVFPGEDGCTTDSLPAFGTRSGGSERDRSLDRIVAISGRRKYEKEQQKWQNS